jgi:hypothetical protein
MPSRSPLLHGRLKALPQISDLLAGADPKVLAKVGRILFDVHNDAHFLLAAHCTTQANVQTHMILTFRQ